MASTRIPREGLCDAGGQHHRRGEPHVHLSRRSETIEPLDPPAAASTVSVPSQHHSLVPNLLIATIILGSAVSLIRQREYWPFSPYSMFARLQGPEVATFDIVGVAAAGAH